MRCGLYRALGDAIKILTEQPGRDVQTWLRSPRRRFYSLVAIKTECTGKKKRPYNTTFVVVVGSFIHTYIVITRRGPPILCYKLFYYFFVRAGDRRRRRRVLLYAATYTMTRAYVRDPSVVRPSVAHVSFLRVHHSHCP